VEVAILILEVLYVLVCIALIGIVLLQQGKTAGLGAIAGAGESYWGKNKARSMEGGLHKATVALAVTFIVLSLAVNFMSTLI